MMSSAGVLRWVSREKVMWWDFAWLVVCWCLGLVILDDDCRVPIRNQATTKRDFKGLSKLLVFKTRELSSTLVA